jgi:hypothetical protein
MQTSGIMLPPSVHYGDSDSPCSVADPIGLELPASIRASESVRSDLPSSFAVDSDDATVDDLADVATDLPEDVHLDPDGPNAFDEDDDDDADTLDDTEPLQVSTESSIVPLPSDRQLLDSLGPQDFAEIYSVPRVLNNAKLKGVLSLDILTGWDLAIAANREKSAALHIQPGIAFSMYSPPCTVFFDLQRLFNIKRISKEAWVRKYNAGLVHVKHSMDLCKIQMRRKQRFAYEHPARASSWSTAEVKEVRDMPGVETVVFDQCMLGLCSKVTKTPMRKRTRIMTNSKTLVQRLRNKICDNSHMHVPIRGNEGGQTRSSWSQCYPDQLCEILAIAAMQDEHS